METKILQVFYSGNNALPFKDKERQVHYPNVGSIFTGENNVTAIRFYVGQIGGIASVTWIANIKKPNGQLSWRLLETDGVDDDGEVYVELDISDLYTELRGAIQIGLNGYTGNINIEEDNGEYSIHGTPNILATGVIQIMVNYSPVVLPKTQSLSPTNEQLILAKLEQALTKQESIYVVDTLPQFANNFSAGQVIYDKTTKLFYLVKNGQYERIDIDLLSIELMLETGRKSLKDVIDDIVYSIRDNAETIQDHIENTNNPHQVTKSQVGLSDVVNSGDTDVPTQNSSLKFTSGGAWHLRQAISYNGQLLDEERENRELADTNLGIRIDQETTARENADTTLHNEIVAERQSRIINDNLKEDKANKTRSISASSSDNEYPTAKAVNDFVNSSINNVSAYYITKDVNGNAFANLNELFNASVFYSGGIIRVPTRNDYCIVRDDANHEHATTRYIRQGDQWQFQYVVNESPMTQAQLNALNSGIDTSKVERYEQGLLDIEDRIRYEDAVTSGNFITAFYIDGVYHLVAQNVDVRPNVVFIDSVSQLPSQNDGKIYFVMEEDKLYRYGSNNWVEVGIYNPMNYVTTYSDQAINGSKTFNAGKYVGFTTQNGNNYRFGGSVGTFEFLENGATAFSYANGALTPNGDKDLGAENKKFANVYANKVNGRNVLQRYVFTYDGRNILLDGVVQTYTQVRAICEDIQNKDVILFLGDMILQPVADDGGGMCEFTTTYNYMGETALVRISINQQNQVKMKYVMLCELGDDGKVNDDKLLFATNEEIRGLR